ncbi:uncharacterized protein LOC144714963 [Wolffia australiana]
MRTRSGSSFSLNGRRESDDLLGGGEFPLVDGGRWRKGLLSFTTSRQKTPGRSPLPQDGGRLGIFLHGPQAEDSSCPSPPLDGFPLTTCKQGPQGTLLLIRAVGDELLSFTSAGRDFQAIVSARGGGRRASLLHVLQAAQENSRHPVEQQLFIKTRPLILDSRSSFDK